MNRTRIIMLAVVAVLVACAFVYVNASVYTFNAPLAQWTRKALSKVGIQLTTIEEQPSKPMTPAAPVTPTTAGTGGEVRPALSSERGFDANRPSRSNRQRNIEQAGFSSPSAASESEFSGRGRRGRSGFGGEGGMDFGRGMMMRMPADFNSANIAAMARFIGVDVNDPNVQAMMKKFTDANDSQRRTLASQFMGMGGSTVRRPSDVNQAPVDANMTPEFLNINNTSIRNIITMIARWTNKVIIPADEALNVNITIYAPNAVPRKEALNLIYEAMRAKGFAPQETEKVIYIKAVGDIPQSSQVQFVDSNELELLANKSQSVRTQFKLKYYSPSNMSNILLPMIGASGYVSADETANSLFMIDSVENLIRLKQIISVFDKPEAGYMETKIFPVRYADPAEIVQLLNIMISSTASSSSISRGGARVATPAASMGPGGRGGRGGGTTSMPPQSVIISAGNLPVTLIPQPTQRKIIAKAEPDVLEQIERWIQEFDREGEASSYDTISLRYLSAQEVATGVNNTLRTGGLGTVIQQNIVVQPLQNAKQLLVVGSRENREIVRKLVENMDLPSTRDMETRTFKIKYADPDQIKANLDSISSGLYSTGSSTSGLYISSMSSYGGSAATGIDRVTVTTIPITHDLIVTASKTNMEKIAKQIEEWDKPLDAEALKPRIVELKNTDPQQMAALLQRLFSATGGTDSAAILGQYLMGSRTTSSTQTQQKIVGALYGQLSFEAVPNTKKIIVISKMPDAYKVVLDFIAELDAEETTEVPQVVVLKYANCEDMAVRLNGLFAENGVQTGIWFTDTGLPTYSMATGTTSGTAAAQNTGSGDYILPWSRAARTTTATTTEQVPISNVIGRIRIIPVPHNKSLLVLSPPKYRQKIVEMITELDKPGKQVMLKAVVLQIDHRNTTSLGVQLASNPSLFGTLNENALTALSQLTYNSTRNTSTTAVDTETTSAAISFPATLGGSANNPATNTISVLIDFLIKKFDAQVLNQQTLWTKDSDVATFFNGDNIALQGATTVTSTGITQQSLTYERVGMVLRTRPNITPEKNVEMNVNIQLSRLAGDTVNNQPRRTMMETENSIIVKDGESIMLGGILFQQDQKTKRKLPFLGDLPVVGAAFQHNNVQVINQELIIFITPYVIETNANGEMNMGEEAKTQLDEAHNKLKDATGDLLQTIDKAGK